MLFVGALSLGGCAESAADAPEDARCRAPAGVDASPSSLVAVFELIDSLPHPVTLECFVESLERPLDMIASTNDFSIQPAEPDSPRVFAINDQLITSWVPTGDGSKRLEFAEQRSDARSVKAEILMPVEEPITAANFEHMLHTGGQSTVCSGCHFDEEPANVGPGDLFESGALGVATTEVVRVPMLRQLHEECDRGDDGRRCDIFEAMFEHGEVRDGDFPRDLPTVYD